MPDAPRSPLDQGLFLSHFARGKQLHDERRYAEAERELEEAYLIRPRDPKVLNLLGIVYFKRQKLDKAEEVYRKLVTESPDTTTLHYNLGLIHYKLDHLEEAEAAFLKALELARDNPRINFYLGSIYERLRRFQDAIFQYRQAGASLMVQRIEGKLSSSSGGTPPPQPAAPGGKPADDTARFLASDVQQAWGGEGGPPTKELEPVSSSVLAGPRSPTDTARFHVSDGIGAARGPTEAVRTETVPFRPEPLPEPKAPEGYRPLAGNFLEVSFSGKLFVKQGTIYSYSGNLTFWVKDKRPGGRAALVILTGQGTVILTDNQRAISFVQVGAEPLYADPGHLLACQESLTPRYLATRAPGVEFLALDGQGTAVLTAGGPTETLSVTPDKPLSVPLASLVMWSGALKPHLAERGEASAASPPGGAPALLRLEGQGQVVVERAS